MLSQLLGYPLPFIVARNFLGGRSESLKQQIIPKWGYQEFQVVYHSIVKSLQTNRDDLFK